MINLQNEQVIGKRACSRANFFAVPRRVAFGRAAPPVDKIANSYVTRTLRERGCSMSVMTETKKKSSRRKDDKLAKCTSRASPVT